MNSPPHSRVGVNPRPYWCFSSHERLRGGPLNPLLAVSPLIELELRGKNERAARDERKPMVPNFILGRRS